MTPEITPGIGKLCECNVNRSNGIFYGLINLFLLYLDAHSFCTTRYILRALWESIITFVSSVTYLLQIFNCYNMLLKKYFNPYVLIICRIVYAHMHLRISLLMRNSVIQHCVYRCGCMWTATVDIYLFKIIGKL